jgi:UDP-galactopyranose mutase
MGNPQNGRERVVAEVLIVGAGLSGAVVARTLAEAGVAVRIVDGRAHVAGNCHTERCPDTGVLVHAYGPHIFHTDNARVWAWVNRFARFRRFDHRPRATAGGRVYSLPVNLHTINQVFDCAMTPAQARAHLARLGAAAPADPVSFEDHALRSLGRELYELFFHGYTKKQWGTDPANLPASVLKRLPLRFDYDDRYFDHRWQAMPVDGYTAMTESILDHPRIEVVLNHIATRAGMARHAQVFYTGPLDAFFGFDIGRLGYRTLDFDRHVAEGDWQGCAVMNHCDTHVPFTRVTEHKHFAPWERHAGTVVTHEYPRACGPDDIPYYPIRLVREKALLGAYVERARRLAGVTFLGRLGTYRYLDMDIAIREALDCAEAYLEARHHGTAMPAFRVAV